MPDLQPINILADLYFVGQNKKLPVDWQQPSGDPAAEQYSQAFEDSEKSAIPEPLCYFWAASTNKYHVDTCKDIGKQFKDFCHDAIKATKNAFTIWRSLAKFKDLKVMSVSAIGTPGCLDAPELKGLYVFSKAGKTGNEKKYAEAVEEGISKCLGEWADKVTVPGLPWYPAFAAFPLAMAPPMPNVPVPIIACPSPNMMKMTPDELKNAMVDALDQGCKDDDPDKQHEALFGAIGTAIATAFLMWLPMQQVMNVMGKGPVPTYAPPYVPVGPVVAGDNLPIPGHLAA